MNAMKRKMDGHNYNIYTNNKNYVRVVSTYAKKPVHGYAVLNDNEDTFDLENGIKLAKARCDVAITEKRLKELQRRIEEINTLIDELTDYVADLSSYEMEAHARYIRETALLADILKSL